MLWAALLLQVGIDQALLAGGQGMWHQLCMGCRLQLHLVAWHPLLLLLLLQLLLLCRRPLHLTRLLHRVLRLCVRRPLLLLLLLVWLLLLWLAGQPLLQLPGVFFPGCEHLVKH